MKREQHKAVIKYPLTISFPPFIQATQIPITMLETIAVPHSWLVVKSMKVDKREVIKIPGDRTKSTARNNKTALAQPSPISSLFFSSCVSILLPLIYSAIIYTFRFICLLFDGFSTSSFSPLILKETENETWTHNFVLRFGRYRQTPMHHITSKSPR